MKAISTLATLSLLTGISLSQNESAGSKQKKTMAQKEHYTFHLSDKVTREKVNFNKKELFITWK